jgi:antitoxin component YwqK of YwqJK toxin-antitoxin module
MFDKTLPAPGNTNYPKKTLHICVRIKAFRMMYRLSSLILSLLLCLTGLSQPSSHDTVFNQTDQNGLKHGWWKGTDAQGHLTYKGRFDHGQPKGTFFRFYEDSIVKARMIYSSDGKTVWTTLYYNDGDLAATGKYVNAKRDSTWKFYSFYSGSLSAEETYRDGLRHGKSKKYNEKGNLLEELDYVMDKKNGKWVQYYPGGKKNLSAEYVNDLRNGPYTVWYESGRPEIEGSFANNLMDGQWRYFDETGKLKFTADYANGVAQGKEPFEEEQKALFRKIDESQGKIPEPDETNFLQGVQ